MKTVSIIILSIVLLIGYALFDYHTYHYHDAKWNFWVGKYAYVQRKDERDVELVMKYHAERADATLIYKYIYNGKE